MLLSAIASQPQAFHDLIKQYGPTKVASMVHTASQFGASADSNMINVRMSKNGDGDAIKTKATRPLNSFIIFRSHYSQLFTGMQQKDISTNVTDLWKHDPFKAKWSILAKAYSVIRDAIGKQNTPLDKFIAINGPYIGILSSGNYLRMLGWKLSILDNQLKLTRVFEVEIASLDEDLLTTNLSVENIIAYSIDMGYVSAPASGLSMHPNEPSMVMASSSVQRTPVRANMDTQHRGSPGTSIVAVGISNTNATVSNANNGASNIGLGTPATATTSATDDAWLAAELQQIVDEEDQDEADCEAATVPADNDDISLMMLSSEFYTLETEYPHNEEFEPDSPTFEFDPYMGDAFNAYNIGDFTEGSAFEFQY
ncbi:hypothetical protein MMC27_005076 [Xylographa pallens]|nr:hypothetical protein [Xylographa pallens]